ncbi:Beach protein, partial [Rhizoctonia solani]
MLKSLLTPLKTRFEEAVSLRSNGTPDAVPESPEDFERDARVETMRMVVQSINAVEDDTARIDLLGEASRLMLIDPATKDVFREMDGFLVLISFLSTSAFLPSESPAIAFDLVMQVFSVAMIDHPINQTHFKHNVGYSALESSASDYLNRPEQGTKAMVLSSFAAFVFQLPSLSVFLPTIDAQSHDDSDATVTPVGDYITQLDTPSARISHPLAIPILLRLTWSLSNETYSFAMAKLFDRLAAVSYANRATMAGSGIVRLVWDRLYPLPTSKSIGSTDLPVQESHALQKLLRRVIDVGAPLSDLKHLFKRTSSNGAVGLKALAALKGNPQARWPSFLSFRGDRCGLDVENLNLKGRGISVLLWIYIEHRSHVPVHLFGCVSAESRGAQSTLFALVLKPDGCLAIQPNSRKTSETSDGQGIVTLPGSMIQRGRWTHLGLTWGSGESGLKMHIDGHLTDTLSTIVYPRFSQIHIYYGSSPLEKSYTGSNPASAVHSRRPTPQHTRSFSSFTSQSSLPPANPPPPQYYISSTHILNTTLSPAVVRLAHHLGPRYTGTLRTGLGRHLTYEAATALNVYLFASAGTTNLGTDLATGLEIGLGEAVVCALLPSGWIEQPPRGIEELELDAPWLGERRVLNCVAEKDQRGAGWASVRGDVVKCEVVGTDEALRRVGGAAVGLGFVQRAETTEMLHESICVLLNSVRTNWRVLEDMENLSGYEVLAQLLYEKAGLISVDIFQSLFEFLGVDFKTPSKSVVTNPQSYRAFALDIDLWARTNPSVQSAYFDHFSTLLTTSKLSRFTIKSKLSKLPVLKKLLLAVQLGIFRDEMEAQLVRALKVVAHAIWTPESIKALVAYLAANLHTSQAGTAALTPMSTMSSLPPQPDKSIIAQRAELVLDVVITVLHSSHHLQRFCAALPASRILLLLLGERPTPVVAAHMLTLLGLMMNNSPSFGRKFELAHGWTVIRCVVPGAWDPSVHVAAFDLLFGRIGGNASSAHGEGQVVNPVMFSTILTALQRGLQQRELDAVMDVLVGEMVELYESVPTFRLLFKTKSSMTIFVDLYRDFLKLRREEGQTEREGTGARLEEKLRKLANLLSENSVIDAGQRQELRDLSNGARPINTSRRASARISLNTLGGAEPTYVKTMMRLASWRKTTATSERQRLRKMIQDRREARRQASNQQEWKRRIEGDSELFPGSKREIKWQLDDTEGPFRVRKKLQMEQGRLGREADDDLPYFSREVRETEDDSSSVVHVEVPPWAESYEIAATGQEVELEGDDTDDKLRHIRHELVAGDVVEEVQNVSRVLGVDAWPGLIIMGKTHLYLVDGLYQNQQGDIVAAIEAPKDAFLIPGVALELENSRLTQKWPYTQLAAQSKRTFLFRDVGLEFYFKDNRTVLVVCATSDARQQILNKIAFVQARSSLESLTPGGFRSPLINRMSARVSLAFQGRDEVSTATRRWQAREISNFAYLSILNQASGRTCNDLTQYPVFPWILSDYTSKTLDLNSPETFRILSKPMGALSPARMEAARTRYSSLESIGEQAFNYGTHFSSSMIVCHFLIRLAPFTHHFRRLQGGSWDLPDRLFHSIQRAWESASEDTRGDVRELIPEMFTCHEFLDNRANLDLGIQGNGERVDNVKLPPWCNDDPYLFIQLHRQALESELVSRGLPSWIDLIWGHKQRDPESFNVFHPLSYEGTIDLDSITDPMERDATVGIIHNFGQTPRKLFTSPHPPRMMEGVKTLPLGTIYGIEESYDLLCHTYRPVHNGPVEQLVIDNISDRIIPCATHTLKNPDLQYIAESYDPTCAVFVDATSFLTGSTDGSVNMWRIHRSGHIAKLSCTRQMQAHTDNVLCVAASKAWSIVVSGSEDETHHSHRGLAAVWDLKRGVHVWTVLHETPVSLCTVMESTGNIATCSATSLKLHTLNGYFVAELEVAQPILALSFHEREYSHMGILATAIGGEIILRTWKPKTPGLEDPDPPRPTNQEGPARWDFLALRTLSLQTEGVGLAMRMPRVTALKFVGESLFHGDEAGRVYSWTLPD